MLKIISVLSVITLIAGCSRLEYASNQPKQYLKSKNGQNLQVSPSLSADNLSEFYRLPNQPQNAKLKVKVAPPKVTQEG